MRERAIEQNLTRVIKASGGLALKFVSPGLDGVPDRIVLLPGGRLAFVEVKAPGKRLRPIQERRKEQLEDLGFRVYVVDGIDQVQTMLGGMGGDAR